MIDSDAFDEALREYEIERQADERDRHELEDEGEGGNEGEAANENEYDDREV
jgi:hypothetical protein